MGLRGIAAGATYYFLAALSIQLGCAASAYSQAYTFAMFQGASGATPPFTFTNSGNNAFIGAGPPGTLGFGIPITFQFTSATGLPTVEHQATFNLGAELGISVQNGASITDGTHFDQRTTNSFRTMLNFRDADGTNLFSSYYEGDIVGNLGDTTATFTGTLDQQFWFINSAYLKFSALNQTDTFSFTLTNITPAISINPSGGMLNSFTADIGGQLSGSPTPVPEPTSLAPLAFAGTLFSLRRTRSAWGNATPIRFDEVAERSGPATACKKWN